MKFSSLFCLWIILGFYPLAFGSADTGAGIILGSPTGLTAKMWQDSQIAFDAGLSFSTTDYFLIYGDYLKHYPGIIKNKNPLLSQLIPYLGAGGIIVLTSSTRDSNDKYIGKKSGTVGLGIRFPFGVEWKPGNPPFGIFAELAPGMSFFPSTDFIFQGGLGLRYYF